MLIGRRSRIHSSIARGAADPPSRIPHLDIMDGIRLPSLLFKLCTLSAVKVKRTALLHLMSIKPLKI
jgi:pentose-5-phosphate-3-epimerase